jgi:Ca2+-binding RTX toxin-like protein
MAKGGGTSGKPSSFYGTAGDDLLNGGRGNDFMYGYRGNDVMRGGAGDDQIQGHQGNDQLFGDDGRDSLFGGQGDDNLSGGAGNDSLWAGTGADTQHGGTGADTFNFGRSVDSTTRSTEQIQSITGDADDTAGVDTILDFNPAEGDRIDLSRIDAFDQSRDGFNDNAAITVVNGPSTEAGTAWIVYDPNQTGHATLYLNQDGGADAEFQLEVFGSFTTLIVGTDLII